MSDLNKMMADIQKDSSEVETKLKRLLIKYETLYKEGYRNFTHERMISGSMDGLEDFQRLVQTVRRNRDVVRSLLRGHDNLRSISGFSFVEEEIAVEKPARRKKRASGKVHQPVVEPDYEPEPELAASEDVDD